MPTYGKVGLIEGTGLHYFSAMIKCSGNTQNFLKFILLELLIINDDFVTEDFLNKMPLKDVHYLITVVSTMIDNDLKML
jgi:hypothetical protein